MDVLTARRALGLVSTCRDSAGTACQPTALVSYGIFANHRTHVTKPFPRAQRLTCVENRAFLVRAEAVHLSIQQPLVSIILPTFRRLKYLRPTVGSVYRQNLQDWSGPAIVSGGAYARLSRLSRRFERLLRGGNVAAGRSVRMRAGAATDVRKE
jgi:hypothetical protein